jgi:sortase A
MTVTIQWRSRQEHRILGWMSQVLFVAGCLALGFCALAYLDAALYQANANWKFDRLPSLGSAATLTPPPALRVLAAEGSPLSRIAIPRLALSVMVSEGIRPYTLARAAGHIPGTAFPDERGNVGIAGHRDTFFRKLSEIRTDDLITLTTPAGSYRYSVEWTRVVGPEDVAVLEPSRAAVLTLVTCYPFTYVGPAPQRFIVRARRMD